MVVPCWTSRSFSKILLVSDGVIQTLATPPSPSGTSIPANHDAASSDAPPIIPGTIVWRRRRPQINYPPLDSPRPPVSPDAMRC